MADVFISYARIDRSVAHRLAWLLQQEGWSTWFDVVLDLGQDFRPEIEHEIDAAACVVVIWTAQSVSSPWVCREALRALAQGKLVEIEVSAGLAAAVALENVAARPAVLTLSGRLQVDETKDELIRRVAAVGRLVRASDGWNATLVVHNSQERPPSHPIIAWEWARNSDATSRICRRVRWTSGQIFECRTTIGNWWQFGYEGSAASLGYVEIKEDHHDVTLPPRNRRRERRANELTIRFSDGSTAAEAVGGFGYPSPGPTLDPSQRIDADAIEGMLRGAFEDSIDLPDALIVASDDAGDPSDFRLGVAIHPSPEVWCRLIHQVRVRDRQGLERGIATLCMLGWEPPDNGEYTGGLLRGRTLTEWTRKLGPLEDLDYSALARLVLETFLAVDGNPPFGSTRQWSSGPDDAKEEEPAG